MNPFGQELKKILIQSKTSGLVSYVGRSAYIQLTRSCGSNWIFFL